MSVQSFKSIALRITPESLRPHWQRLKASPLSYRLAKGAFWSLVGTGISRGLGLVSTVVAGRMLGSHGFGELGMIQSTVGLFGTVAGFGLGMSSTKHVSEFRTSNPMRAGRIIALASATAWASSSFMAGLLFLAAPWVASHLLAAPHAGGLLRAGSFLLLLNGINGSQTGSLAGLESFKAIARVNLVSGLLSCPLMILGVWIAGVQGSLWGLVASAAVNCMLNWHTLRIEARRGGIPLCYEGCTKEWPIFIHFNLPGVLNSMMLSFSAWACGAILVNQLNGYNGMGVINAIKRIQQVPEVLIGMILSPFLPVLSEAFGRKDMATYGKTLMLAFSVAIILMVPFSILQIGAPWLTLLPYGETYMGQGATVQWTMVGSIAYGLLWPLGTVIISLGRMWLAFWLIVLNTILFLGLGYFLVPRYGPVGYAAASSCSFILSNIPSVFFLYSELGSIMRQNRWRMIVLIIPLPMLACWCLSTLRQKWLGLMGGIAVALIFAAWLVVLNVRRSAFGFRSIKEH